MLDTGQGFLGGGELPRQGQSETMNDGGVHCQGVVANGIFDGLDWMPTLVAAAGGPEDLPARLKEGYEGYKVHLDGYNILPMLEQQPLYELGKGLPQQRRTGPGGPVRGRARWNRNQR